MARAKRGRAAKEESKVSQEPKDLVPQRFVKLMNDGDTRPLRIWCHPSLTASLADVLESHGATLIEEPHYSHCEVAIFPRYIDMIQDDFVQLKRASMQPGLACVIEDWVWDSLNMDPAPGVRRTAGNYIITAPPGTQVPPDDPTQGSDEDDDEEVPYTKRPRKPITREEMMGLVWAIAENDHNVSAGIRQVCKDIENCHSSSVWTTHYKKRKAKYLKMIAQADEIMQEERDAKDREDLTRMHGIRAEARKSKVNVEIRQDTEVESNDDDDLPVVTGRRSARSKATQDEDEDADEEEDSDPLPTPKPRQAPAKTSRATRGRGRPRKYGRAAARRK